MNKEAGNNTLAKAHTLHPIAEIYSSIEPQISNTNATLNETLATNLNQFSKMVNTSSVDDFDTQSQKINGLLNQTVTIGLFQMRLQIITHSNWASYQTCCQ